MTARAGQGSIIGPVLRKIFCDGILRMEMTENSFLVGYTDDIV